MWLQNYRGAVATTDVAPVTESVTLANGMRVPNITLGNGMRFPKIIWLLWYQGWDHTPTIVQRVLESWQKHNPDWTIIQLWELNLPTYVDIPRKPRRSQAAFSDVVRLSLLAKYGGVWADATMMCMEPLNDWVWEALAPSGLWMYHGRDNCKSLASWFIISSNESYIMQEWKKGSDEFWLRHDHASGSGKCDGRNRPLDEDGYFWMDYIFETKRKNDKRFESEWSKVPTLCCETPGSSHYAANKGYGKPVDCAFKRNINKFKKPHAIKLNWRFEPNEGSTGHYLSEIALGSS